jgi:isocitrate/isopropylmalate dehydrogenase
MMKTYEMAVIPGDGIGKEVVSEGLKVLEAAGANSASASTFANSTGVAKLTKRPGA